MKKQFWAKLLVLAMVLTMLPVAALATGAENAWVEKDGKYVLDGTDNAYVLADDTTLADGTYTVAGDAEGAALTLYNVTLDTTANLTIKGVELVPVEGKDSVNFTVNGDAKLVFDGVTSDKVVYLISGDTAPAAGAVDLNGLDATVYADGELFNGKTWPAKAVTPTPAPGGGATTPGDTTDVVKNEDGSTTTTMTTSAGKGVTTVPAEDATEGVTTAEVELKSSAVNSAARTGEAVELPVPALTATDDSATAPVVKITVPASVASKSYKVAVPMAGDKLDGVVPVIVTEDGEEVVKVSAAKDGKLVFAVEGNVTVKLVDKSVAFTDVADSHWAASYVDFASARELLKGVGGDSFAPAMNTSRSMLATILYRLDNEPEAVANETFEDIVADTWYTDAAFWAISNEIINGQAEGVFAPDADITRGELVTMIYRFAKYAGIKGETKALDEYADADQASDWNTEAMSWCVGSGIVNGRADDEGNITLGFGETAQRAEVATMLQRLVTLMLK